MFINEIQQKETFAPLKIIFWLFLLLQILISLFPNGINSFHKQRWLLTCYVLHKAIQNCLHMLTFLDYLISIRRLTQCMVHEKPKQCSWAYYAIDAWYIGPSLEHYHCFKCFIPSTRGEGSRDPDTVKLMPCKVPFPKISTEDYLMESATYILHVLQNPPPSIPLLSYGNEVKNAITTITHLLQQSVCAKSPNQMLSPCLHNHWSPCQGCNQLSLDNLLPQINFQGCRHLLLSLLQQWQLTLPHPPLSPSQTLIHLNFAFKPSTILSARYFSPNH